MIEHMFGIGRGFDRVCDLLLDRDSSDLYGDEIHRLTWYEAIAVGSGLHSIAINWALFVLALIDADRFAPALWTLFVVWMVPLLASSAYVRRRGVREPDHLNRAGWAMVALTYVPLVAFLATMVWPPVISAGAVIGNLVVLLAAAVAGARSSRRRRRS